MSHARKCTQDPPTLAAILERLENTRRLVQLSLAHHAQAKSEATEALGGLQLIEAELDLITRAAGK